MTVGTGSSTVLAHVRAPTLALGLQLLFSATLQAANGHADPVTGTPSVTVEGKSAVRQGDQAGETIVQGGSTNVIINGRAAATVGSQTGCGGTIVTGSSSVFINGKPMANSSSIVTPCPK